MKKFIAILTLLITLVTLHFTTYKSISSEQLPVSTISDSRVGYIYPTMDINYKEISETIKMEDEFWFVHDEKIGHPNGSYTLTKQTNIFGITRYIAHDVMG